MGTARFISGEELRAWRRKLPKGWQRAVSAPKSKVREKADRLVGDDAAEFTMPVFKPIPPAQAAAEVAEHLRRWATRSRDDFQVAVAAARCKNPTLFNGLSDEQALALIEQQWAEAVRRAVIRVYNETGRGDELAIRIGA